MLHRLDLDDDAPQPCILRWSAHEIRDTLGSTGVQGVVTAAAEMHPQLRKGTEIRISRKDTLQPHSHFNHHVQTHINMHQLQMLAVLALVAESMSVSVDLSARGECNRRYTVQENDICDSISAANNVSTYQLATVNAGYIDAGCGNLIPGDSICLGYNGDTEDCIATYVVQKDDSCDAIESQFAIGKDTLYANNPQINEDCDNIYIGEVLCVSDKVQVPPAASAATTAPTTRKRTMRTFRTARSSEPPQQQIPQFEFQHEYTRLACN
ncbi:hypothetical protein MKEN_01005800 [Mycena kentingensis (nom. inval.)]|nr:hypothetical protein MKEN_01005800 [Mycena kentingensis (nom. inval.)]